ERLVVDIGRALTDSLNVDKKTFQRNLSWAERELDHFVQSAPDHPDVQRSQAAVWERIGYAKSHAKYAPDVSGAIDAYETAKKIRQHLVTKNHEPGHERDQDSLIKNLQSIGEVLSKRDGIRALGAYHEALEIARSLAQKHKNNITLQFNVP